MKTAIVILAAALLCGCQKPSPTKWEYKTMEISNSLNDHHASTTDTNFLEEYRSEKSDAGDFDFDSSVAQKYGVALRDYGNDGWELVAAIPQAETVPQAEYWDGHDFSHDPPRDIYKSFSNFRTAKIILIFKRPQK